MSHESPFSEKFGPESVVDKDPNAKAKRLEFRSDGDAVMVRVWYEDGRVGKFESTPLIGNEPAETTIAYKKKLEKEHGIKPKKEQF